MSETANPRRRPIIVYPALTPAARNTLGRVVDTIAPRPQPPKDRT
jgi:hypothetical protein